MAIPNHVDFGPGPVLYCRPFSCAISPIRMMEVPELKERADECFNQLIHLELDAICDRELGACRSIGQKLFHAFRSYKNASYLEGEQAMQYLLNKVRLTCPDGDLRVLYIDKTWKGITNDFKPQKISRLS